MERIDVDPNTVDMRYSINWIFHDVVKRLEEKIRREGWETIPTVAICNLPQEVIRRHQGYAQLRDKRYLILGDGLHRRCAASKLECFLPCTLYFPHERVDMRKHGLQPTDTWAIMEPGQWFDEEIRRYLNFLKPYIKAWEKQRL